MLRKRPLTAEQRRLNDEREEWAARYNRCWGCGRILQGRYGAVWVEEASQVHEIIGRPKDWRDPRNYSFFCNTCHTNGADAKAGGLTLNAVLTLKLLLDPTNYDLDWIREHHFRKGMLPEPLPSVCDWLFSDAAINERQG